MGPPNRGSQLEAAWGSLYATTETAAPTYPASAAASPERTPLGGTRTPLGGAASPTTTPLLVTRTPLLATRSPLLVTRSTVPASPPAGGTKLASTLPATSALGIQYNRGSSPGPTLSRSATQTGVFSS